MNSDPDSRCVWRALGAAARGAAALGVVARVRGALLARDAGLRDVGLRAAI